MQRRPSSSGPRSSHFFQSKGMQAGEDCLPTSYLFKEMQELAASRQNTHVDESSPLSALLESRKKTILTQQQASLTKNRSPQQYKRLQDLPAPEQGGQVKRKQPERKEVKKATKKMATAPAAGPVVAAVPGVCPMGENVLLSELMSLSQTISHPTVVVTLSTDGWCNELGGLCPATNINQITVTCSLFGQQQHPVKVSHHPLTQGVSSVKDLLCSTNILKVTYNVQGLFAVVSKYILKDGEVPVNTCDVRTMLWLLDPGTSTGNCLANLKTALATTTTTTSSSSSVGSDQGDTLPVGNGLTDIKQRHIEIQKMYLTSAVGIELSQLGNSMVRLEMPLAWILAKMNTTGFCLDVNQLTRSQHEYQTMLANIERDLSQYVQTPFNVQSHEDVRTLLFETLRLQDKCEQSVGNLTKKRGIISTDKETLLLLSEHHPAPSLILKHRAVQKLLMTYIVNLSSHAQGGLVHPHFNQEGTDTGRLSCSSPNLQNQPRKDHEHTFIDYSIVRSSFKPHPGDILLTVDYSQIEVRILAHMSQDRSLCTLLKSGGDMHRSIAARIFEKRPEEVTASERQVGKKVIFGMIYGQGQKALAATIGVSVERAAQLLQGFRRAFPGVQKWSDDIIRRCLQTGEVRTLANRLRKIKGIASSNSFERAAAIRQSINTIIQGSAADVIKVAMLCIQPVVSEYRLRLVCQVHDEVILSAPRSSFPQCIPPIENVMETSTPLSVPLKVSTSFGPDWGNLTDWNGSAQQREYKNKPP